MDLFTRLALGITDKDLAEVGMECRKIDKNFEKIEGRI